MCNCIKEMNQRLRRSYGEIARVDITETTYDGRIALTGVFKPVTADGRYYRHNRYLRIRPAFCPFCGKPYDPQNTETGIINPYRK